MHGAEYSVDMKFLSGEIAPEPFAQYASFADFRDAHLRNAGLSAGSQALYIQSFPGIYPGDIALDQDPRLAVMSVYNTFVTQFKEEDKCNTARLLLMPGVQEDEQADNSRLQWYAQAFAATQEAGEEVRIAWYGDVAANLEKWAGQDNPYLVDYNRGLELEIPRAGLWSILSQTAREQFDISPSVIGVMNYIDGQSSVNQQAVFEGCAVYKPPFNGSLLHYERAWRRIFHRSVRLSL